MKNFLSKIKKILPSKRRLIQLYAALLFNANLKGFINGRIYQGGVKNICTPGLNCYSCPGASGACPLGALQNSLYASGKTVPYYVFGIIILYGIIFGRFICGFLCPFGLVQDLLHKIPTPKLEKNRVTKALSYLKYVLLVLFVFVLPLIYMFKDFPLPGFCKYICPAGTLGGAIGLLVNPANDEMFGMLGPLFTWKFVLLIGFVVSCVFIYRAFCRFFCPLGAIYGLFNRFSVLGIKLDKKSCTECGRCITKCKMDISRVGDHECINCGECVSVCPTGAIQWRGGKILLPKDELPENATPEQKETYEKKATKKRLIIRIVAAVLMVSTLVSALVYYNFIDKIPPEHTTVEGALVPGDPLPDYSPAILGDKQNTFDMKTLTTPITLAFVDPDNADSGEYVKTVYSLIGETTGSIMLVLTGCTEAEALTFLQSNVSIDFAINHALDESGEYYAKFSLEKSENKTYVISGAYSIFAIFDSTATKEELAFSARLANTNATWGYEVGKLCYGLDLPYIDGYGTGALNVTDPEWRGKTVVLNFWYTSCGPCVEELPHFNKLASEYADQNVVVVTVHNYANLGSDAPGYIANSFPGTKMLFVHDTEGDVYYSRLGFKGAYPATVIIDSSGIVSYRKQGSMTESELKSAIENALLVSN